MCATQPVPNAPAVAGSFGQAGETSLGQMLARHGRPAAGDRRESRNVGFTFAKHPQNSHTGWGRWDDERDSRSWAALAVGRGTRTEARVVQRIGFWDRLGTTGAGEESHQAHHAPASRPRAFRQLDDTAKPTITRAG